VRGYTQSRAGIFLIVLGVVCLIIGLIIHIVSSNSYISASEDALDALEDNDDNDYFNANNDALDAQRLGIVGNILEGVGLIIAFLGIALHFFADISPTITPVQTIIGSHQPIQQQRTAIGTKYCLNCGKPIPINVTICPYCQQKQNNKPIPTQPYTQRQY
jgi:uncharacterized membrane protein